MKSGGSLGHLSLTRFVLILGNDVFVPASVFRNDLFVPGAKYDCVIVS